jgi:hypothetical protein
MMMDRTDEARPLFKRIIAHDVQEDSDLRRIIRDDFAEMRKAGITHPMMAEIEKAL